MLQLEVPAGLVPSEGCWDTSLPTAALASGGLLEICGGCWAVEVSDLCLDLHMAFSMYLCCLLSVPVTKFPFFTRTSVTWD